MSDNSHIEWTDATWNPITGCSIVSPGCTNCYAMKLAGTRLRNHPSRAGLTTDTKAGPVWNGKVRFNEQWLTQPMEWRKPRMIFVCAHGDLFHEDVPDEWIDRVFAVMAFSSRHTFQVLTKRAARMREYAGKWFERLATKEVMIDHPTGRANFASLVDWSVLPAVLPNVWLGASTERQQEADERIPLLLQTPAAVRFISAEPLLGPIDLAHLCILPQKPGSVRAGIHIDALRGRYCESGVAYKGDWDIRGPAPPDSERRQLDWVIVGGESGPDARPMHPDWARSLRDQCEDAGVPFFFKQWGNWMPDEPAGSAVQGGMVAWPDGSIGRGKSSDHGGLGTIMFNRGKARAGRVLDGVEYNGMPERA